MDFQPLLQAVQSALVSLRDPLQLIQLALTLLALGLALWLGRRWHPELGDGWRIDLRRRLTRPAIVLLMAMIGVSLLRALELPYRGLALVSVLALSLLLIRSCGLEADFGSITSGEEHFYAWKTLRVPLPDHAKVPLNIALDEPGGPVRSFRLVLALPRGPPSGWLRSYR